MQIEDFKLIFIGKHIILVLIILFVIIRYIRFGMIKIDVNKMLECKLKKFILANNFIINVIFNAGVIIVIVDAFVISVVPAVKDFPALLQNELIQYEGEVAEGSPVESKNKIELYNIVIECNGEDIDLHVYGKNGIRSGDYVSVQYLPHTKEGIIVSNSN